VSDSRAPIELSVESFASRDLDSLIAEAASEFTRLADRLRELRNDVDATRNGSRSSTYLAVALDAQRLVTLHTGHAPLLRMVKSAAEADVARAVSAAKPAGEPS
jgi:hypothetical protein